MWHKDLESDTHALPVFSKTTISLVCRIKMLTHRCTGFHNVRLVHLRTGFKPRSGRMYIYFWQLKGGISSGSHIFKTHISKVFIYLLTVTRRCLLGFSYFRKLFLMYHILNPCSLFVSMYWLCVCGDGEMWGLCFLDIADMHISYCLFLIDKIILFPLVLRQNPTCYNILYYSAAA